MALTAFIAVNVAVTLWTLSQGFQWYGFGFLCAEAVDTTLAIGALVNRSRNLEYLTFVRQPVSDPERARAALPGANAGPVESI